MLITPGEGLTLPNYIGGQTLPDDSLNLLHGIAVQIGAVIPTPEGNRLHLEVVKTPDKMAMETTTHQHVPIGGDAAASVDRSFAPVLEQGRDLLADRAPDPDDTIMLMRYRLGSVRPGTALIDPGWHFDTRFGVEGKDLIALSYSNVIPSGFAHGELSAEEAEQMQHAWDTDAEVTRALKSLGQPAININDGIQQFTEDALARGSLELDHPNERQLYAADGLTLHTAEINTLGWPVDRVYVSFLFASYSRIREVNRSPV